MVRFGAQRATTGTITASRGSSTFAVERPSPMLYSNTMSQTLEGRVEELEKKVAELTARLTDPGSKDWRRTIGIFQNDPEFEEAVRLGQEYRKQQTYEKEIAGS